MSKVMRSNPSVKHGKRLNGKTVIIRNGDVSLIGEYEYYKRRSFWLIGPADSELHLCEDWCVEEIVESEE